MTKNILVLTAIASCVLMFTPDSSYTAPKKDVEFYMTEHMKKAEQKNPAIYNAMIKRAGGPITGCLSCHKKAENKRSHFRFLKPDIQPEPYRDQSDN
jgi:hypothetical protein